MPRHSVRSLLGRFTTSTEAKSPDVANLGSDDTRDEGLRQIDELQRLIVLARTERLECYGVPPDEAARACAETERLAAAVCDGLRAEYRARLHG